MTSKEEKSTTFTLEDGTFIFVESSRRDNVERSTDKDGIPYLQVKGSIVYLRLGDKIALVSNGTIRIFNDKVCIDGEKIVIIHKGVTIYTPKEGSATLYKSASDTPRKTLVHGWKIYVVLRNKRLFIDSFAGWRQATVGTTYSGKFQFIEGIEYTL